MLNIDHHLLSPVRHRHFYFKCLTMKYGLFHVVQIFAAFKFWLAYIHDRFYQALFNPTQYKDIRI